MKFTISLKKLNVIISNLGYYTSPHMAMCVNYKKSSCEFKYVTGTHIIKEVYIQISDFITKIKKMYDIKQKEIYR